MQSRNSGNKEQKPISLSELSFADIAKMRREREQSDQKEPAPADIVEEKQEQAVAVEEESAIVEFRDDVEIEANYYKMPNDLQKIAPLQDPKEHCLYTYLYRLSYGWGRNFCRVGYAGIMRNTSLASRSSVARAVEGLIKKKHVIRIEEGSYRRAGTLYRVLTPQEIIIGVFKLSTVNMNIVKLSISKSTMVKLSIVNMKTDRSQNEYSQYEDSEENSSISQSPTISKMNIVKPRPNKNSSKDTLKTTEEPGPTGENIEVENVLVVISSDRRTEK
jgi:hypothetical protein